MSLKGEAGKDLEATQLMEKFCEINLPVADGQVFIGEAQVVVEVNVDRTVSQALEPFLQG